MPFTQIPATERTPTIVVRTAMDPGAVTASLRSAVAEIDRALALDQVETMQQLVSASVGQPRFRTMLVAAFSILALAIASMGIYGATKGDVIRLVLRRAAVLIGIGLSLGLIGSAIVARLITKLLYGVHALDPAIFVAVALLLSAIAFSAGYIPALRATRVDPLAALRYE